MSHRAGDGRAGKRVFQVSVVCAMLAAAVGVLWFLQTRDVTVLLLVAGYGMWLAAAGWVYQDAKRRGQPGVPWALVVFVGHVVGLAVYLAVRALGSRSSQDVGGS